ncbi:barstar family protein [Streptomyces sp. NPDC058239]|uniref:barstar family protein n=1 Tax=Streptomyces sp. NPDC058239 TaxID=3346395 RepID=UPI0036EBD986
MRDGRGPCGPGGYFGREWNAFKDCLGGGFGVALPFTLIWHHSDVARQALAGVVSDPDEGLSYFEDIIRLLNRCGVTVVLQLKEAGPDAITHYGSTLALKAPSVF